MVPFDLKSVVLWNFPSCHGVEFLLKKRYVQPETGDQMKMEALSGTIEMRIESNTSGVLKEVWIWNQGK